MEAADGRSANIVDGANYNTEDKCAAACTGKLAWPETDGYPNSSTSSSGGSDGAAIGDITICYGYEFSADLNNDGGTTADDESCMLLLEE
jgi:hypothetical protein